MTAPKTWPRQRPLSPHMTIWRWRIHMLTSITHRITGNGLALVAASAFAWWLAAAASGAEAYELFRGVATSWIGILVGVGLTWSVFQHMASGLRHLGMDAGAGYEIGTAKTTAALSWLWSTVATIAVWAWILLR